MKHQPWDEIKLLERGAVSVDIRIMWGTITWHASTEEVTGTSLDKAPFTITGVSREALIAWLKGALVQKAFPRMALEDRELLITGYA